MPPSGFNEPEIAGLIACIGGCCKVLDREVEEGKHPNIKKAIKSELAQIERASDHLHTNAESPSGSITAVIAGTLAFVGGCYKYLLHEIEGGNHASDSEAIAYGLAQIESILDHIHIDSAGRLVDKYDPAKPLTLSD